MRSAASAVSCRRPRSAELREITRYRRQLTEERSREVQRLQKLLEDANVKLSSVATDVSWG